MTYSVNGTNLDNFFEARSSTATANIGYSRNGTNFSTIYQTLEHDSRIPDIDYGNNGTNLSRLYKGNIAQYSISAKTNSTRTQSWNDTLQSASMVTFGNATLLDSFFTFGGRLTFSMQRTGGSSSAKNTEWSSLLNDLGSIEIAKNATFKNTQTQVSSNGINNLNSSYQLLYTEFGSSPYTSAEARLYARIASSTQVQMLVVLVDGASGVIDESIDGTLSVFYGERRHPTEASPTFSITDAI